MKISHVEIVTVSEAGARINFRAGGGASFEASCSPAGGGEPVAGRVESVSGGFYLVEFAGLASGADYKFRIKSGAGAVHEGAFTTLRKPKGDFRFRFATVNDIHIGEKIYGLIFIPGMKWPPLTPGLQLDIDGAPFWQFTNEAAIRELNKLDLDFVIVKGDLVTDHNEANIRKAKEMLDTLRHPYHILRGNHDRAGRLPEDYFMKTFALEERWSSFEHGGCGFLLLEDIHPDTGNTCFSERQLEWFAAEMKRLAHLPVFVFMHNPPLRKIERANPHRIEEFLEIVDSHPKVAGVFYGHTHGNKRIMRRSGANMVPFVETAATMDYPGGFNIYDVYGGGYIQTCVRPHDARMWRWYKMCSEKAYFGLAASGLFGKIDDRNFTWEY